MKNLRTFALFFACAILCTSSFTACKKANDGKPGANGATGTAGATGATGAKGATGINGNTMLNGTGAPLDTLGAAGDFYLDLETKMLYGPKTSNGWGDGVTLEGPAGQMGPAGPTNIFIDTFTISNAYWANRGAYYFTQETNANNFVEWPAMDFGRYNPTIADSIISSGVVIVDVKTSPSAEFGRWSQLPYSWHAGDLDMNLDYRIYPNVIVVDFYLTTNFNNITPIEEDIQGVNLPDYQIKVITIPASTVTWIDRVMTEQKAKVKMN